MPTPVPFKGNALPKQLVLVSYRPLARTSSVGRQASRQGAGVVGSNQRRKSDRRAKRGRRGDDGPDSRKSSSSGAAASPSRRRVRTSSPTRTSSTSRMAPRRLPPKKCTRSRPKRGPRGTSRGNSAISLTGWARSRTRRRHHCPTTRATTRRRHRPRSDVCCKLLTHYHIRPVWRPYSMSCALTNTQNSPGMPSTAASAISSRSRVGRASSSRATTGPDSRWNRGEYKDRYCS